MKIAIITNDYPPESKGGAGRIAATYADFLAQRGHEIKVWGPSDEFRSLASKPMLWRIGFHLRDLKSRKVVVDEIIAWHPDVLISHNLTGCGMGTPWKIKRSLDFAALHSGRHVRWAHFLHDVQLFEPSGQIIYGEPFGQSRRLWRWSWAGLRKKALGNPDVVISPTKWLLGQHVARGFFGDSRQEVIPNPISFFCHPREGGGPAVQGLDSRLRGNDEEDFRMTEGGRDKKQILFVGRLDEDKGVGLLLDGWRIIRDSVERLVFVGDGRMRRVIESIGDTKIEVKGNLAPQEVAREMSRSGVVVVPSLVMENQPTVILEALSCGCNVVASDVGGVSETLGRVGRLFKPGSVDDLVRAVREALAAPETDLERDAAVKEILQAHEPSVCGAALEGLLKSNL